MSYQYNGNSVVTRRPFVTVGRLATGAEVAQAQRQMDSLVGKLLGFAPISSPGVKVPERSLYRGEVSPDIYETEEQIDFILPLPGVDASDLQVEVTGKTLTIRGERKPLYQNVKAIQHRRSAWSAAQGKFELAYTLPLAVDPDKVLANYRNGVLQITLPKPEVAKPKTIKVDVQGN